MSDIKVSGKRFITSEELKDSFFDVTCLACKKFVFTLPFMSDACHRIQCPECGDAIHIYISPNGSISAFRRVTLLKILESQKDDLELIPICCTCHNKIEGRDNASICNIQLDGVAAKIIFECRQTEECRKERYQTLWFGLI